MDLTISIVSWNTRELLDECLASIRRTADSQGMDVETIVVDNHSSDGSVKMVSEKHPDVILIANDENRGFAAANNQAFEKAKGRYILMLNPDTAIRRGALRRMVEFMDEHREAGAAGCRLVNPDGTDQHSVRGFPSFAAALYQFTALRFLRIGRKSYEAYRNKKFDFDKIQEVDSPMGAAIIFRREVLGRNGLLDPAYFMYYEEVDICRRLKDAGHKVYFIPDAVVVHHGGRSARQDRVRLSPIRLDSMMTYFCKHEGRTRTLAFKLIFYPLMALRMLIEAPGDLLSAATNAAIKNNTYKAKRCVDSLRAKGLLLIGRSEARALTLLFLFALLIRVLASSLTFCVSRDAMTFLAVARHIQGNGLASAIETAHHPLFPMLLAGFQALSGRSIFGAQLFCSLLSALTVVPLYFLARDVFGKTIAALTGAIFVVHNVVVCDVADILSEPAYLLFYTTAIWLGLRAVKTCSYGYFAGAGAASGLAYLTRPEGIGSAMIVGGWAALLAIVRARRGGLKLLPGLAVFAAVTAMMVLPYSKCIGWRLTTKKKLTELVALKENVPRPPDEPLPKKTPSEHLRYLVKRMRDLADVLRRAGHMWLFLLPFGLLARRSVRWEGFGEIYLASAVGFNLLLCYAVIIVFCYLSDRHLLAATVLLMPWMAVGVQEALAGLEDPGRVRRVVGAAGAVVLIALAVLTILEDFGPRRMDRAGERTAGLWVASHMPGQKICGLLSPRVAAYADSDYDEMRIILEYDDGVDYARRQGAGIIVINTQNFRAALPDYDLDVILNHKDLRERFSCEEKPGSGLKNIIVFEVLPRRENG